MRRNESDSEKGKLHVQRKGKRQKVDVPCPFENRPKSRREKQTTKLISFLPKSIGKSNKLLAIFMVELETYHPENKGSDLKRH